MNFGAESQIVGDVELEQAHHDEVHVAKTQVVVVEVQLLESGVRVVSDDPQREGLDEWLHSQEADALRSLQSLVKAHHFPSLLEVANRLPLELIIVLEKLDILFYDYVARAKVEELVGRLRVFVVVHVQVN